MSRVYLGVASESYFFHLFLLRKMFPIYPFVESIQSDTSLTLKTNVSFTSNLLTVVRGVVPDDTDFVVFSDISQILDAI